MIQSITELDLHEKRVFIRVDFNCPIKDGVVTNDTRILAALPTIRYAIEQKARIILASHLGRPTGTGFEEKYSLAPVAARLADILTDCEVLFPETCIGDGVNKLAHDLHPGQVMLLENLRFHAEEEKNDEHFARELAQFTDVYINDAFGAAHRSHASVVGLPALCPNRGAGLLMKKELDTLGGLLAAPARPFLAILGGAKVSDKLPVVDSLLNTVQEVIIGGGMAYTFLKSRNVSVGSSLVDESKVFSCGKALARAETKGIRIHLPKDHVVAASMDALETQITRDASIPAGMAGFDIGPATVEAYRKVIARAKTILWNGPMGVFEHKAFGAGTHAIAEAVGAVEAKVVVGGGDSIVALQQAGMADKVTHVSTGGGASLKFLEGKPLPGVKALEL